MSYYTNNRPELQALVPIDSQSLLDVGCGEGLFAKGIKQKLNNVVWGIEPNPIAATIASAKLDKVLTGTFEEAFPLLGNQRFDTICFNDVLEHMAEPWQCLQQSKKLLNPNGIVIASVPNVLYYHTFFKILISKDWHYQPEGIMDITHLRWFTQKSLRRMFEECGYTVVTVIGLSPATTFKMKLLSLFSFSYFTEMKYPQFAIIAKLRV